MPSLDVRIQAQGGPQIDFTGTLDSGASRTVLSTEDAEKLGLGPSDMRDAGNVVVADGSQVACLAPLVPIRGKILGAPSPGGDPRPWGRVFEIDTVFLEHASPLWGQADFFQSFEIIFQRYLEPSIFSLSY